jgi:hypothetical protein
LNVTWTELNVTAEIGDWTITLNEKVDWKVGAEIIIAPSSYDHMEAEIRTIVDIFFIDEDRAVIVLE